MMYVSISRDWLFSPTARRVYLICAILNLALLATRMGIALAMVAAGASRLPSGVRLMVRTLLFPEIVGTAVLFVGMSYCWLGLDGSYKKKVLWFILLGLFLLTMPIYYFSVYRPLASLEAEEAPAQPVLA